MSELQQNILPSEQLKVLQKNSSKIAPSQVIPPKSGSGLLQNRNLF
jgi:hypothetical protein